MNKYVLAAIKYDTGIANGIVKGWPDGKMKFMKRQLNSVLKKLKKMNLV